MRNAGVLPPKRCHTDATGGYAFVVFAAHVTVVNAAVGDEDLVSGWQGNVPGGVPPVDVGPAIEEKCVVAAGEKRDELVHDAAAGTDVPLGIRTDLDELLWRQIEAGEMGEGEGGRDGER